MNLKQLEAFVKVTESGSFSKAAKLLFLTQPTVSAHISSLEKELDSRLFVRNTKEVKLSEEGKQLYQYARQMVELEKEIEQVFSKDAHREEKCITIATSTIPAQYVLPAILAKFRETYPDEQFRISENDSCGVVERYLKKSIADICLFIRMNWLLSCRIPSFIRKYRSAIRQQHG